MKPSEIFIEFINFRLLENGVKIPDNSKELLTDLAGDKEFNRKLDTLIIEHLQDYEPTVAIWRNQNE